MPVRTKTLLATVALTLVGATQAHAATGDIKYLSGVRASDEVLLDEANGIDISDDGRHVYVAAQLDDAVNVFKRNSKTGKLRFVEAEVDGQGGVAAMNGSRDVTVSPDGKNVYVTATVDNGLTEFDRNKKSGRLTFSEDEIDGEGVTYMDSPEQVAVSPDNRQVYVTSLTEDGVAFFHRSSGDLLSSGNFSSEEHHNGASGIAISPDGDTVIVGGFQGDQVAVYERSPGTGFLTFRMGLTDGLFAEGLDGVRGIAFNEKGDRVFFAGHGEDALSWYDYDAAEHDLTYRDDITPNPEVFALTDPFGVTAVGKHVYVASETDGPGGGALGAFRVISNTALTAFDSVLDDDGKSQMLGRATEVVASPDGAHLYVSAGEGSNNDDDDAVTALARDQKLKLKVKAAKSQKAGALTAKIRCSTACRIVAKAKSGSDSSKTVRKRLAADVKRSVKLPLAGSAAGETAKVTVRAKNAFGERKTQSKKVDVG